jgi:hypothetical protein
LDTRGCSAPGSREFARRGVGSREEYDSQLCFRAYAESEGGAE